MKNIRGLMIPVAVLFVLFILCCLNMRRIDRCVDDLLNTLEQVDCLAEAADWQSAEDTTLAAKKHWEDNFPYLCIFINHSDTESVTTSFNSALSCLYSGDFEDFRCSLSELKCELTIISEAEHITFENIL